MQRKKNNKKNKTKRQIATKQTKTATIYNRLYLHYVI